MMNDRPVNRQSIKDAIIIFGPSSPNCQGKTTRTGQGHVNLEDITPIPSIILYRYSNGVLGIDIVKIRCVHFFNLHQNNKFSTASEL